MVRYYSESGDCPFGPEADVWQVLGAVDAYVRTHVAEPVELQAADTRGRVLSHNFDEFKAECEDHGQDITTIWMDYGKKREAHIWFNLTAYDFDRSPTHPYGGPKLRLSAGGVDPAVVRGAVAEAIDRVKTAQPAIPAPPASRDSEEEDNSSQAPEPARMYSAWEHEEIEVDRAWVLLDLADAAATRVLGGDLHPRVSVRDARGEFSAGSVHDARVQWEQDRFTLHSLRAYYSSDLPHRGSVHITIDQLQSSQQFLPATLSVSVSTPVYAEAERLAREIAAVAKPTDIREEISMEAPAEEMNSVVAVESGTANLTAPTTTPHWVKRMLDSPYSVQIVGGTVAGLLVIIIGALWLALR